MSWLSRLFGGQPSSAKMAKDRLKVVIGYDRAQINPQLLELIKDDIVNVISQRIPIDRGGIKITSERGDSGEHLIADIPIVSRRGSDELPPVERGYRPEEPSMRVRQTVPSHRDYPAPKKKKRK